MSVYDKIKDLCDSHNLAVTALEKELGWGRGSIGKLKNGGDIASSRLQAIAEYFGVSTDFLLGVQTDAQPGYYIDGETADIAQEIFETPGMRVLFDAARDSRPEDIQMAADLLKRLKKTNPDE